MLIFKDLTEENYIFYAIKNYDNPQCAGTKEFYEDLSRIVYLKRLFRKYKTSGELKERLILNHIIILYNVFGIEAASRLLFFKIEEDHHSQLKTFLIFLNYIKPESDYVEWGLSLVKIGLDKIIVDKLRQV